MFPRTDACPRCLWLIGSFPKKSRSHTLGVPKSSLQTDTSQALQRSSPTPAGSRPLAAGAACAGSRTSYRPGTLRGARPGRQSRPCCHYQGFLTASWAPFRGAVLQLTAQPTPSSVDVGQRGFRGSSPGLTPRAKAKLPKATSSIGRHGSEQDWPARLRGLLRRRWRGASGDAVRRLALPHSGRPRCRTFLAGKRHR